jgi:hypothetical protein
METQVVEDRAETARLGGSRVLDSSPES